MIAYLGWRVIRWSKTNGGNIMDWQLLGIVPAIFLVIMVVVLLWGARQMWKVDKKFIGFILLALAVALGIMFYAMYGKKIFG